MVLENKQNLQNITYTELPTLSSIECTDDACNGGSGSQTQEQKFTQIKQTKKRAKNKGTRKTCDCN